MLKFNSECFAKGGGNVTLSSGLLSFAQETWAGRTIKKALRTSYVIPIFAIYKITRELRALAAIRSNHETVDFFLFRICDPSSSFAFIESLQDVLLSLL